MFFHSLTSLCEGHDSFSKTRFFKGKAYPSGNQSIFIFLQMSLSKKSFMFSFCCRTFCRSWRKKDSKIEQYKSDEKILPLSRFSSVLLPSINFHFHLIFRLFFISLAMIVPSIAKSENIFFFRLRKNSFFFHLIFKSEWDHKTFLALNFVLRRYGKLLIEYVTFENQKIRMKTYKI